MKKIDEATARTEWQERAKKMTLAELPEFLRELSEDYQHDYGTICVAIGAAAVAAAWAMEKTPQGGITDFQAGAVTWEMIRGWNSSMIGESGARIQNFDDLLYPQYVSKFTAISPSVWEKLQEKAKAKLQESAGMAHERVVAHWKSIVNGIVPAGLHIGD